MPQTLQAIKKTNLLNRDSKIHLWAPDLFSTTGGIQAFCQHFIHALQTDARQKSLRLLVKNDSPASFQHLNGQLQISGCGNWQSPWRTPRFALECLRQASRERPELIIAMHIHFAPLARLIHQTIGTPYILMAYGIEAWQMKSALRRKALQQAHLILAISRYTRDSLLDEEKLPPEKVQLLAPTFSPGQFSIQPKPERLLKKYALTVQTPVILTVCRLSEDERYKGYDRIIEGLPQILGKLPQTRYILVGTGSDRERIEKLAKETGVEDAVIFAGFVPNEELCDYYNLCDVFAMPSKREGFGIVYLEAMACGKPTLGGNQDGTVDALCDGELGVLVDPEDTKAIAEALTQILQGTYPHPLLYQPQALRQKVIETYGFDKFKEKLNRYLEEFAVVD